VNACCGIGGNFSTNQEHILQINPHASTTLTIPLSFAS